MREQLATMQVMTQEDTRRWHVIESMLRQIEPIHKLTYPLHNLTIKSNG